MKMPARPLACALLASFAIAGFGCGGTSPPVRYFTLASETPTGSAPTVPAYTVAVGPVTVPEIVDRPHL
ncbi:MAG TPA: hypothetical protein VD867_11420, partial [Burkholderiales bacterium]|nr:hypothetical protein [Burkholderiales bacterium]